jgi:uncharacterized protein (DUF427 family)
MYQAKWNNQIIAEALESEVLQIEGNVYFPKEKVNHDFLVSSDTHTTCPWKGMASYFSIKVGDDVNTDAAWYYPSPKHGAIERVAVSNGGKGDFSNFIAFWRGVEVVRV